MRCERCGKETLSTIMSKFNTDTICTDSCLPKERAHPKYAEASRIEHEAVKAGSYNFKGVGKPADP